jgi:hypothetical protein
MRFMPTLAGAYALAPLLLAGLVPPAVHAAGVCPRCAPQVTPVCPAEEVERARTALAWVHRPFQQPVAWIVLAVHLALTFGAGGVYGRWTVLTVLAAGAGQLWALRCHARVRPWCPWCSGGGHGDEEAAQVPDGPGGLALDPTPPADGPADESAEELTVAGLQAGWAAHPAPAEPARPVRTGPAGVPGQRGGTR